MKQKIKITTTKLFNHLHKVKKKHVEKFVHTWIHTHHAMIHIGELFVVWMIWFSSLLFANYNNSYQHLHRNTTQEIVQSLHKAIEQEKPKTNESKIISVREMDGNVDNTFAVGYCTYGAARISPEFFPYSEDKMSQERTRGGNAIDRCENAEKAWFTIGKTPSVWSLIVYKKVGSNTTFGHVGKIMYYNTKHQSLIVRDMNRIAKFIMSDRWENADNENIKCYIYPKKENSSDITSPETKPTIENSDKFWNNTGNTSTNTWENIKENTNNKPTIPSLTGTVSSWASQPNTSENANQNHNSAPEEKETQEQENTDFYSKTNNEEIIVEPSEKFSDITNHFLSQYEMKITIIKNKKITIWEKVIVEIHIINKENKEEYQGILPFVFNSISQNDNIENSLTTIQLIHNQNNNSIFTAKKIWVSTIIITIDDEKITTIPIVIE